MAVHIENNLGTRGWNAFLRSLLATVVFVCVLFSSSIASAETRKLKLYFLHTGERAEITYKKNGKYVDSGLKKINRFLRDWRRNEPTKMDPRLLDLIWEVYQETGSRKHIHVISAYRSPATNSLLRKRGRGVARKSQHTLGKALDFFIPGVSLRKLRNIGLKKGLGGVGYYPKSGSPFVHMDTGRVRHWPRMSRKELAGVFPRGKTLHVPTDGKPLAKYNQAKAEYERKVKGQGKIVVAKAEEIEKKPGLFAKLLGRGEDEDGAVGAVAAPKAVVTTAPKPEENAPALAAPTPQPAAPEPPTSEQTPETLLAKLAPNLVPVPIIAPRVVASEVAPTVVAEAAQPEPQESSGNNELEVPRPEVGLAETIGEDQSTAEQQIALAVPVPAQRPAFETVQPVALAAAEENNGSLRNQNLTRVAALSPTEIEDLRREVYAVLEEDIRTPVTAALSNDIALPSEKAGNVTLAASAGNLSLVPQPNPLRTAEPEIKKQETQTASLIPLEPGTKETGSLGLPVPKPEDPISVAEIIAEESYREADDTIPIPVPAQREILLASNNQKIYSDQATDRKLESLETVSLEERILGKWALAADASIANIAEIRPPAYARNIIRELPNTVLSRGFAQDNGSQTTSSFSGSSLEFLSFTKFN